MDDNGRQQIFDNINAERDYQDKKWGVLFDDKNTLNDWVTYINRYLASAAANGVSKPDQYKQLLKAATIAVAALESFYRNNGFPKRHYDE